MLYDLIILGAGPAGITASVYAARKRMNFIVITGDIGGQAAWSGDIENYTGYQIVTGPELVKKFEEHMHQYNIPLKEGEQAIALEKKGNLLEVKTEEAIYQCKTCIVATGKKVRELKVPGEKEYKNKGLTYCATCDGPLFANKDVAVIGGGNSALDACLQLVKIAYKVYLINNTPALGGDPIMREKVTASDKVTILNNHVVTEVVGDKMVTGIRVREVKDPSKPSKAAEKLLNLHGVFVEIGLVPNSDFVKGVEKNKIGEIIVDCHNSTTVPGIYAAGDVTSVPEKQIIIAAGEGAKALLSAFRYLATNK